MATMLRKIAYKLASTPIYFASVWAPDRIADAFVRTTRADQGLARQGNVVLAATGGGNIGDQAMLEAVLANEPGPITVICKAIDDIQIPDSDRNRVTLLPLRRLLSPVPFARLRDAARFRAVVRTCERFAIIGADLMDGLYNPGASIIRSSLSISAAKAGCESRILGFSWPEKPQKYALTALRRAGENAKLYARDPISFKRLCDARVPNAVSSADVVFAFYNVQPVAAAEARIDAARAGNRKIAVVNVSALIEKRMSQAAEYSTILEVLDRLGYEIIVTPHVIRRSGNDLNAAKSVLATVSTPFYLIEHLMTPSESRWLAGSADVIITGRMHLAIFGLAQGIPAITLGTQGKVEGLYLHFKSQDLVLQPTTGFGERAARLLTEVTESQTEISARFTALKSAITDLARLNFT